VIFLIGLRMLTFQIFAVSLPCLGELLGFRRAGQLSSLPQLPAASLHYLPSPTTTFHLPTTTCYLPRLPDKITWADKAKAAIESWIGEEMTWELFGPPRRPIPEGKVRLLWHCVGDSALVQPAVVTDSSLNTGLVLSKDVSSSLPQNAEMEVAQLSRLPAGISSG
jgi:hypothetical protein